jgi:hypothetical protein
MPLKGFCRNSRLSLGSNLLTCGTLHHQPGGAVWIRNVAIWCTKSVNYNYKNKISREALTYSSFVMFKNISTKCAQLSMVSTSL